MGFSVPTVCGIQTLGDSLGVAQHLSCSPSSGVSQTPKGFGPVGASMFAVDA